MITRSVKTQNSHPRAFMHLSEENTRTNQSDYKIHIAWKKAENIKSSNRSMYWWLEDITVADLGRRVDSWTEFRLGFCCDRPVWARLRRGRRRISSDEVCSVRNIGHNPRRTTSTTWFIVAPMYLLIKHRIDLSPATAKYPYHRRRSTSPASASAAGTRRASQNP